MLIIIGISLAIVSYDQKHPINIDTGDEIDKFENRFGNIQEKILVELVSDENINTSRLLNALTSLPLKYRNEYEKVIQTKLPNLSHHQSINELFCGLVNPLVSFLDYGLLDHIIVKFGSDSLKKEMHKYGSDMKDFMRRTTLKQLIELNYFPGQSEVPQKFCLFQAKIDGDASECTLEQINVIRRRYCCEVKLSEIVFHLVAVVESNSFIIKWLVPSILISDIMKSSRNIEQNFYQEYKITVLTLDAMWMFLNKAETDTMWFRMRMNDTSFKAQFHSMYKQIVYELKIQEVSKHKLSLYLMDQHLKLEKHVSDCLSQAFLKHKFTASFVDIRILTNVIERFGSICLKGVMRSYCKYLSMFTKQSTAQQLVNLSEVQSKPTEYFLAKCRIMEEPSSYRLQKLFSFQTGFCTVINISEVCFAMHEVYTESGMSGSFTVSWLVPSAQVSGIMKFIRNAKQSFYQEYKITSLTLDGMWLFISEAEIDALFSQMHVSNTKLMNLLHIMHKQIIHELEVGEISQHELSSFLRNQHPNLQNYINVCLSEAFLNHNFPLSLVDFRILTIVIQWFGSDYLKCVLNCYCKFMLKYVKQSTVQQLIGLSPVHSKPSKDFIVAESIITERPLEYGLEKLLNFQTRFCTILNISKICFVMGKIDTELSGLFTVSWHIPLPLVSDIIKCITNIKQSIYQEYKIISFTLDTMWLFVSDPEIDVMWTRIHMSDAKFTDQFHIMYKQIVYELKMEKISVHNLTLYLKNQEPKVQTCSNDCLSEAFLTLSFPVSFIDFRILAIVIEGFGNDCLKRVMKSYGNHMLVCTRQLTAQQLMDLAPIQSKPSKEFVTAECTILEDPSHYKLDQLLTFQTNFCRVVNFSKTCFVMGEISKEIHGSFIVSWLVPSSLVLDLLISANQTIRTAQLFEEVNIASMRIGSGWLYNCHITPFGTKLKEQYQQSQGSPSPVEWIPSPTRKIFRLAMIQRERVQQGYIEDRFIRMTISGRVDDILHSKSPVKIEQIFSSTPHRKEIVLIEGAPGSGKSTLTIHICQRWGKGELFQQFTVVILVQLRDPAVQRAQTIADLLPVENAAVAQELASELIATNGRGVLWVLDGWDELPTKLQKESIFRKLLPPTPNEEKLTDIKKDPHYAEFVARGCNMDELWVAYLQNNPQNDRLLLECSVIVTSRPVSSGDLHPVVSSRIEVLGFTSEEQKQYFTECLKGDTKALEALLEKIQENPVVQSICYLPLNAAFIVHTFKYKNQSLPNTEYEIYLSVILSCIQRHFEKESRHQDLPRELTSFDDLFKCEAVREPFQCLCELAYHGVMENKVTISSSDLSKGSNTLSLLQVMESFLQSRKSVFYNFLHLSIQEVLSGYYIATQLSESEQVSQFQKLFNQPRFTAVLQFYAAITKLERPGIRQVITRIVEAESKPLLLSLLRCLHEAQDPSLCFYVAESLNYKLYLAYSSLSPLDCLSISFFLLSVTVKDISVNLTRCYIDYLCAKCLTKYLCNNVDYVSEISLNLEHNEIHKESASQIARVFYFIKHLYLSYNIIGDMGVSFISEAIRETVVLKTLILYKCGITSSGAEDLSRAVAHNSSLVKLDIGENNLGDEGISHVAEALKQNTHLKELWIAYCGITDKGATSLASALSVNNSLKMLHIGGLLKGALTEDGLSTISQSVVNNSEFVKLVVCPQFDYTAGCLRWKINETREKNRLPPIEIEGE